jgi:hypothetical protein
MSPAHYALAEALDLDPSELTGSTRHPIATLTEEEAHYWHAKCSDPDGSRGQQALAILIHGSHLSHGGLKTLG